MLIQRAFKDFTFLSLLIDPETFPTGLRTENAVLTECSRVEPPANARTRFTDASSFFYFSSGSIGVTTGSGLVDEGPVLLLPPSLLPPPLVMLLLLLIENPTARVAAIFGILSPVMILNSVTAGQLSPSFSASNLSPAPLTSLYLKVPCNYLMNKSRSSITF